MEGPPGEDRYISEIQPRLKVTTASSAWIPWSPLSVSRFFLLHRAIILPWPSMPCGSMYSVAGKPARHRVLARAMPIMSRGAFAFNIAESLRSMQRLAGRRDARPCGLIRKNTAHDKAAPTLARKRISLPSCQTLLFFRRLPHVVSIARPRMRGKIFT